ncbi:hypothetical protein V5799_022546 [Amblyomma americanum]|uniref:Uncharacterized protein n=1 Tax=Amblyomma americanum TaxID=6943 RepID=A0AAQ4FKN5_AMBAM
MAMRYKAAYQRTACLPRQSAATLQTDLGLEEDENAFSWLSWKQAAKAPGESPHPSWRLRRIHAQRLHSAQNEEHVQACHPRQPAQQLGKLTLSHPRHWRRRKKSCGGLE